MAIPSTIDTICGRDSQDPDPSPGRFLTVWAINRVLDPTSATRLERWTPTTDLPLLVGAPPETFSKDIFLRALYRVCHDDPSQAVVVDHIPELEETLSRRWRQLHPIPRGTSEVIAYDLTGISALMKTTEV